MPSDAVTAFGGPARSVAMGRRQLVDKAAGWVVGAGGLATVASILAILVFITVEVFPLWRAPRAQPAASVALAVDQALLGAASDEYRQLLYGVSADGMLKFVPLQGGEAPAAVPIAALEGHQVGSVARAGKDQLIISTTDGTAVGIRVAFDAKREGSTRRLRPRLEEFGRWTLFDAAPLRAVASSAPDDTGITLIAAAAGAPVMLAVSESRNVFGDVQRSEVRRDLPLKSDASVSALAVTANGKRAFVGTSDGWVHYWDISDKETPRLVDAVHVATERGTAVTALSVLIGDTALVVGDAAGSVSVWFPVRDAVQESGWRLQRVHDFEPHQAAVTVIAPSPRDKGFLSADANGRIALRHSTSAQTLLWLDASQGVRDLVFAPKADAAIATLASGEIRSWDIVNPHPEISLSTLFGKVWYEGYEEPAYVWQSTGGTDAVEPKFSLVPLIIGTLKGTFYALLFAVPIAVLAAIYTSQFMHPRVRAIVKPVIELMAALPSVVLGFLAGLWLAPVLEDFVPALLAMLIVVPGFTFGFGFAWQALPLSLRARVRDGYELGVLALVLVAAVQACIAANGFFEDVLFAGNFRGWLLQEAGLRFDQRNCLVVGFAMGFAVIPIIFTIAEDALSNVPQRLISASLALGATRWQTAMRVVFPTASPGIFSAIMVGFGRAVGETMIVLMATGNTPILDFNIFTGMRTLAANIAVEIPEAPQGGTLYRVLFLAALMLFAATFVLNTVAEVVRQRLRKRYQQL